MKKFTALLITAVITFALNSWAAHPERDLSRWFGTWKTSHSYVTHGTLIERPILTPGDPLNPPAKGAVLKYISKLSRGVLHGMSSTHEVTNKNENELLYIVKGKGRIEGGGETHKLKPHECVLIPPNVKFRIYNETAEVMEMIIVKEPVPEDFETGKEILVKNAFDGGAFQNSHWCHTGHGIFSRGSGLYQVEAFAVVSIDGMNIAEPHSHKEGQEEIWYQLTGDSYTQLGKQLYAQPEGTAFLIPPDSETPHTSINVSNEPMLWLFIARWNDR